MRALPERIDTGYLPVFAAQRAGTEQLAPGAETSRRIREAGRCRKLIAHLNDPSPGHSRTSSLDHLTPAELARAELARAELARAELARAELARAELTASGQPVTFAAIAARTGFSEPEIVMEFAVRRPCAESVQDAGYHKVDVAMIEPGNCVAQVSGDSCGETGGDVQNPVSPPESGSSPSPESGDGRRASPSRPSR